MSYTAKDIIAILERNGFEFKRSKGSHHIYENSTTRKIAVVLVHGNKDMPKGTFFGILKQAGIDKNAL
ncbi:MAG: type II toxin-antitoxin system HicA family toxin [Flammeovirgaceae bacterium]|nr:MAG: type II toxin-antitoxin system HicA family toxin [Flammeovirgaceae bacterium]